MSEVNKKSTVTEVMKATGKGILGIKSRRYYIFDKSGQAWVQTAPLLNEEVVLVPEADGTHFLKWAGREKMTADDNIEVDDYEVLGYPGGLRLSYEKMCARF